MSPHGTRAASASYQLNRAGDANRHSGLVGLCFRGVPVLGPYGVDGPMDGNSTIVRLESCYTLSACDDPTTVSCYAFEQDRYNRGVCYLDRCNGRETVTPEPLQDALGDRVDVYFMTLEVDGGLAFPCLPFCNQGDVISGSCGTGGGGMNRPPPGASPPPGN
ncbi:MAG: YHYH protein [Myxococcota bacterium]|nr:YHYH protein [Myxococcota bacterium]